MSPEIDPFEEFRRKKKREQQVRKQVEEQGGQVGELTTDRHDSASPSNSTAPNGFESHRSKANSDEPPPPKPDSFQKY